MYPQGGGGYPQNPYYPGQGGYPSYPPQPPHHHHGHHHHHSRDQYQHSMLRWEHSSGGSIPYQAVQGGYDAGVTVYIGRAHHCGDLIPGKIHPSHGCCYVSFDGHEHSVRSYEVLTNPSNMNLTWQHVHGGIIPPGAIEAGRAGTGEPLYIGRHEHEGTMTVGKVHPSHKCLYIPYGGREHCYHEYEVLCVPPCIY